MEGDKEEKIKMNLSLDKTKPLPNGRFKWKVICK